MKLGVNRLSHYALAALCVLVATAGRFWLSGLLQGQPFPTFLFAVLASALVGGPGPALFATFLSAPIATYFFVEPLGEFRVQSETDFLRTSIFTALGFCVALVAEVFNRSRRRMLDATIKFAEARVIETASATLKAREEFISNVLDSLPHEIAVIDASGTILAVNRRWERFAEANNGCATCVSTGANYLSVSRRAADLGDHHARCALEGLDALLSGEDREFAMEYPCHSPLEKRWFLMHAARAESAPAAVVVSHTDITERRQAEERLLEATEKLRRADRRKDQFLATLAHELRNPLAAMRSATYVLGRDEAADRDPGRERGALSILNRQLRHLIRLVDDLLEVSRITTGKIALKKECVDLMDVLRNAVETAQPAIDKGGHELKVDLPAESLMLDADPLRLEQIFTNLLSNAAKYTGHGGAISLVARREGDQAVVRVHDTGIGISPEMLLHVFTLFTQASSADAHGPDGLGIGLALARKMVELHAGNIEAQSAGPGRGCTFIVRLPIAAARCGAASLALRRRQGSDV